ncbi:hypothetical protein K7X08_022445 [Anisodus acutangulus]|uniref:Uncharacterized protein n=1 Tax=Anisodus acutangulus TaxID=402998 RepID=A0A9Q1MHQ1_9SOLA|nr:hypothetical protein K7X08_022445 [Anisodus acutangulus]
MAHCSVGAKLLCTVLRPPLQDQTHLAALFLSMIWQRRVSISLDRALGGLSEKGFSVWAIQWESWNLLI